MADFEQALNQHDYGFETGQIVRGKAFSYESDGALIDVGGKSPAILPKSEASVREINDLSGIVPLGEEREFLIIRDQNADGQVTVSIKQLEARKIWIRLVEMQANSESLQVRVTGTNKGGVTVDALGLRGFIPRSHLASRSADLASYVGQTLSAAVLELDQDRNKIVLSNRNAAKTASFSRLEVGQLVSGTIASLKPFGAFVDFDGGTGLLHIAQISKHRVDNLEALLSVGQSVNALIVDLDEGRGRISLATKFFENYPGEILEQFDTVSGEAADRQERAQKALLG